MNESWCKWEGDGPLWTAMRNRLTERSKVAQKKTSSALQRYPFPRNSPVELRETVDAVTRTINQWPCADNATGAVDQMLRANAILRNVPWPAPFDETTHRLRLGDARDLSW